MNPGKVVSHLQKLTRLRSRNVILRHLWVVLDRTGEPLFCLLRKRLRGTWVGDTVEPLSNDHPHQRPSLLYDHISYDGQCFLFVRSLTNDHPSNATNNRLKWNFLPRGRPLQVQCICKNRGWRFNIRSQWWIMTMLRSDTFEVIQ